jgi:hypothetical protein
MKSNTDKERKRFLPIYEESHELAASMIELETR